MGFSDAPDAPIAPAQVLGSATSFTLSVFWNVPNGNAYAVDYYQLQYQDTEALTPTWVTVQCDKLGDGVISDWLVVVGIGFPWYLCIDRCVYIYSWYLSR